MDSGLYAQSGAPPVGMDTMMHWSVTRGDDSQRWLGPASVPENAAGGDLAEFMLHSNDSDGASTTLAISDDDELVFLGRTSGSETGGSLDDCVNPQQRWVDAPQPMQSVDVLQDSAISDSIKTELQYPQYQEYQQSQQQRQRQQHQPTWQQQQQQQQQQQPKHITLFDEIRHRPSQVPMHATPNNVGPLHYMGAVQVQSSQKASVEPASGTNPFSRKSIRSIEATDDRSSGRTTVSGTSKSAEELATVNPPLVPTVKQSAACSRAKQQERRRRRQEQQQQQLQQLQPTKHREVQNESQQCCYCGNAAIVAGQHLPHDVPRLPVSGKQEKGRYRVRQNPRKENRLAQWYRKYGYVGAPYCKACSESFRSHLIRLQNRPLCGCTRETPCSHCTKVLSGFSDPPHILFAKIDAGKKPSKKMDDDHESPVCATSRRRTVGTGKPNPPHLQQPPPPPMEGASEGSSAHKHKRNASTNEKQARQVKAKRK